jgi:hypothetical protein
MKIRRKMGSGRALLKHPNPPIFGCASMAPLTVGQGSKEPARGGVLGVSSATSFFLEFPLSRGIPTVRQNRAGCVLRRLILWMVGV